MGAALTEDLRRLANFFRGKAEPISEPIGVNAESVSVVGELHPDCLFASLDEQTVKGLVKRSRESSEFTVNDFLLDALFQSLAMWNQENDPNGDRSIRIGMATDMRDPDDEWLPAANKVSMVFLTQQTNLHPDRRLKTLNDETTTIKKNNMGLTLCRVLNWVGRIPGGMRRLLSKRDCFSTAILSNRESCLSESKRRSNHLTLDFHELRTLR